MKNNLLVRMVLPLLTIFMACALNIAVLAQGDNPLVDHVPQEWIENINYSDSEEDVITDGDGYDNFNLGVDFAEPHLTQNPNNPVQFFGAYNINEAWRTSDGHNWFHSTPSFGTSVNGDPCTAYDGSGNLYYETMYGGISGCKVIRSTNNGATWSSSVTSILGGDKNWLAADQTSGPYAGYVYTTMTRSSFNGHGFARSTNNGSTWTTTFNATNSPLPGAMVCVGPNGATDGGAVYFVTNSGSAFASSYTFYVSTNGGANFTFKSSQSFAGYVGTNVNGRNSVENMRTRPYPFIAADQSNGTYRGRLYCVYASNTPAGNGNKPDIFSRYSTNQGSTWSSPVLINDDASTTNNHQWHPSIWCDMTSGRLFVKWMDTRNTPASDYAEIYASYSDDGGVTWAQNQRISNQKMKINCTTCGGGGTPRYQGDYDAIVSVDNQSLLMWTDFRFGNFGSYVSYFPDFAMKVLPTTTSIKWNNGNESINVDVPSVKLYSSTAIFSATVFPTPPNGTITLDFPSGNTLSSFPGSVALRITTSGNVTAGTYTITVQGEGPNGTPVHRREVTLNVFVPDVEDPTFFTAEAFSDTGILLGFATNPNLDNVVIAWNLTGTFAAPTGAPPAVGQSFAGGTLLYNGTSSPVIHSGLNGQTIYYYKAFSYDNIDYSPGIEANDTTFEIPKDFSVDFLVYDNCVNSISLTFGTAPSATECYDPGLDQQAPPPPPTGVFDGRFTACSEDLFIDYKSTNPDGERIWDLKYVPTTGCEPISFSWDPGQLPPEGNFRLIDPHTGGNWVNVDMRTTSTYAEPLALGYLQIIYNYGVCAGFNLADGWNMISLPLEVSDAHYLSLFPNANPGSLFEYSEGYFSKDTVGTGTGYWLKMPGAEIVDVCGTDITECVIDLELGWNMIGGPNCNVPLSSVGDPGGIIIPGSLFLYAGGYFTSTSIDATEGYWINTNAPGTITVSCGAPLAKNSNDLIIPLETLTDFGKIDISDGIHTGETLYFNGKLDEAVSIESYSMPPVPPQGSFDLRLTGDYRLSESDEVTIQVQSTNYPLSIIITDLKYEEGYGYLLQEIVGGVEAGSHRIIEGVEIVIGNEKVSLLKITKQEAVPSSYSLEQNYPNPFNPSTTIKFAVPKETNVNLSIYNVLGEIVSTIVDEEMIPGYYEYKFDASNLASGVYLYRLQVVDPESSSGQGFVETKKMVLLR